MVHTEIVENTSEDYYAYCYRKAAADILGCCIAFRKLFVKRYRAGGDGSEKDKQLDGARWDGQHGFEVVLQWDR